MKQCFYRFHQNQCLADNAVFHWGKTTNEKNQEKTSWKKLLKMSMKIECDFVNQHNFVFIKKGDRSRLFSNMNF